MKRGSTPEGFTIVETLIFLAVSSAILVSALVLVGGSQSKTQFNTAMNDVSEQITKVINNVSNGYYPSQNTGCEIDGNNLSFPGTKELGESVNCVYLGRIIEFNNKDNFRVYSVAGAREYQGSVNTEMANSKATTLDGFEEIQLKNGITVESITPIDNLGGGTKYNSLGFFTSLGDTETNEDGESQLASGALSTNYIAISSGSLGNIGITPSYVLSGDFRNNYDANKNPEKGVRICFRSGTTDQFGIIDIGGENRSATISTTVQGSCS
jgi:type II secretory pathway pseudopilin PulG